MATTILPSSSNSASVNGASGSSRTRSINSSFENKAKIEPVKSSIFEEATSVELSDPFQAARRASDRAERVVSNATSFIDVAENVVNRVSTLVDKAKTISEKLKTEVDPTKRSSLSNEAASLLGEIDTIASDTTFNGTPVVNGGKQSFKFSLVAGEQNSDNTFLINVASVTVARSDLGISSLTSSSINADAEGTFESLETAQSQLAVNRNSLADSRTQVDNVAKTFGLESAKRADSENELLKSPEEFAQKIASSIQDTVSTNTNNLDASRVEELLAEDSGDDAFKKKKKLQNEQDSQSEEFTTGFDLQNAFELASQ